MSSSDTTEEHDQLCAALFVLVARNGGQVLIGAEDLPSADYTILRRRTEDGGLEIRVSMDRRQ